METPIHITGGIQDLIFGPWMPLHLVQQYESGEHSLTDRLWELPDSPADYIQSDKRLLNRWQGLADSSTCFKAWTPPFYRLSGERQAPFHPLCRFYDRVTWCESRMMIQAARHMQETLPLTELKFELVTLRQEIAGFLQESHQRVKNMEPEPAVTGEKLSLYLHNLVKDSMFILLLELNERFNHLLDDRGLSLEQICIKYLREPVPDRNRWVSTLSRIQFLLSMAGKNEPEDIKPLIKELLFEVRNEKRGPLKPASGAGSLQDAEHFLENALACSMVKAVNEKMMTSADLSDPDICRNQVAEWQRDLVSTELTGSGDKAQRARQIFQILLMNLGEIKEMLNREGAGEIHPGMISKKRSEAAVLISMIEELFAEIQTVPHTGIQNRIKGNSETQNGHWLLDQYISVKDIEDKLKITPRTMRTYISKHQVPVIEISQKNKWITTKDFEMLMENLKKEK